MAKIPIDAHIRSMLESVDLSFCQQRSITRFRGCAVATCRAQADWHGIDEPPPAQSPW